MTKPGKSDIAAALRAAGAAHHDYESNVLNGRRDALWAGWYAAYALGRLGDITTPAQLTAWLELATGNDWADGAAEVVLARLG